MSKKPFTYDAESRSRGLQRRAQWSAIDKAIADAMKKSTGTLVDLLRDGVAITEQRHLDAIADLIERRRGHPIDRSPRAETKALIVGMVRHQERLWRRRHPGKPLQRGLRNKLIERAIVFVAEQGPKVIDIPIADIHAVLRRGRTSR